MGLCEMKSLEPRLAALATAGVLILVVGVVQFSPCICFLSVYSHLCCCPALQCLCVLTCHAAQHPPLRSPQCNRRCDHLSAIAASDSVAPFLFLNLAACSSRWLQRRVSIFSPLHMRRSLHSNACGIRTLTTPTAWTSSPNLRPQTRASCRYFVSCPSYCCAVPLIIGVIGHLLDTVFSSHSKNRNTTPRFSSGP